MARRAGLRCLPDSPALRGDAHRVADPHHVLEGAREPADDLVEGRQGRLAEDRPDGDGAAEIDHRVPRRGGAPR